MIGMIAPIVMLSIMVVVVVRGRREGMEMMIGERTKSGIIEGEIGDKVEVDHLRGRDIEMIERGGGDEVSVRGGGGLVRQKRQSTFGCSLHSYELQQIGGGGGVTKDVYHPRQ